MISHSQLASMRNNLNTLRQSEKPLESNVELHNDNLWILSTEKFSQNFRIILWAFFRKKTFFIIWSFNISEMKTKHVKFRERDSFIKRDENWFGMIKWLIWSKKKLNSLYYHFDCPISIADYQWRQRWYVHCSSHSSQRTTLEGSPLQTDPFIYNKKTQEGKSTI